MRKVTLFVLVIMMAGLLQAQASDNTNLQHFLSDEKLRDKIYQYLDIEDSNIDRMNFLASTVQGTFEVMLLDSREIHVYFIQFEERCVLIGTDWFSYGAEYLSRICKGRRSPYFLEVWNSNSFSFLGVSAHTICSRVHYTDMEYGQSQLSENYIMSWNTPRAALEALEFYDLILSFREVE